MKDIIYYVVYKIYLSSTPNDSDDDYYEQRSFEQEDNAIAYKEELKETHAKETEINPSWQNKNTLFRVQAKTLRLY